MTTYVDQNFLRQRKAQVTRAAESLLLEARAQGREHLNDGETARFNAMRADLADIDAELERTGQINSTLTNLRSGASRRRREPGHRPNCRPGSEVMPLHFDLEELRAVHTKVLPASRASLRPARPTPRARCCPPSCTRSRRSRSTRAASPIGCRRSR
jgi:hypothetical protein